MDYQSITRVRLYSLERPISTPRHAHSSVQNLGEVEGKLREGRETCVCLGVKLTSLEVTNEGTTVKSKLKFRVFYLRHIIFYCDGT